jgi:hypothetical protein
MLVKASVLMFPRRSNRLDREKMPPGALLNCCPAPDATEGPAFIFEASGAVHGYRINANRGTEFARVKG